MKIEAVASGIPEREVSNEEILDIIRGKSADLYQGDLDQAIRTVKFFLGLCGSDKRRWAKPGENVFKNYTEPAILNALEKSNSRKEDIDLIIYSSVDRKVAEPGDAFLIAKAMGFKKTECFDVLEACNSWSRAAQIAQLFLKSPKYKKVLIITNEFSVHEGMWGQGGFSLKTQEEIEWCFPSFTLGEGATATILSGDGPEWNFDFLGMPEHADLCLCPLEDFSSQETEMNGINVAANGRGKFTSFGRKMEPIGKKAVVELFNRSEVSLENIDIFFPHSHAKKVWMDIAKETKLNFPYYFIFPRVGNLISGSIPGAMSMALDDGKLTRGSRVAAWMAAAGMSFSFYTFTY